MTIEPLLPAHDLDRLRSAFTAHSYTVAGLSETLGLAGQSALARGDLLGVQRLLPAGAPETTLVQLFLLGDAVATRDAAAALAPLDIAAALRAGILHADGDQVCGAVDIRPYAEADSPGQWWVVSDLGSDVRGGPLPTDHVLGVGSAALTLAAATVRTPVERALDLGTGCGVQALHLSEHSGSVTATDISPRALRMAATTAALSGQRWELRAGDALSPVAGEKFDLIVANPPFVVGPQWNDGFDYRDSGLAGDEMCHRLITALPEALTANGTAQLLANWIIPADCEWTERLHEWLAGRGVDAWVWQREVVEPGEYVSLWLRDAGERPGTDRWRDKYLRWRDWFDAAGVAAVGMGMVNLRRTAGPATIVCEDVPQAVDHPMGVHVDAWFGRARWLAQTGDGELLAAALRADESLVRTDHSLRSDVGWTAQAHQLRQARGMRWEIDADPQVAALVAGCDGQRPVGVLVAVLASSVGAATAEVAAALLPVVRDLVQRGILNP